METKLKRIAQISKEQPKTVFTSIYHLINEELLLQCHKELDGNKAVGIDKMTKDMYNANLEENIKDLVTRLKNKAYKPAPALRVYIPKGNGKMRPLGISIYEDKIVQLVNVKMLCLIYHNLLTFTYKYNKIYNVSNKCCKNMIHEVKNWKPFIIRRYYEKY